jgi:hypothetical protein
MIIPLKAPFILSFIFLYPHFIRCSGQSLLIRHYGLQTILKSSYEVLKFLIGTYLTTYLTTEGGFSDR